MTPSKRCEYGVVGVLCSALATTKRQRPAGGKTWEVCGRHAVILDRLRTNIAKHRTLLARLEKGEP